MKLLLDTHALLWVARTDAKLGKLARVAIEDASNDIWVSVVSLWEIATKVRIGKMVDPGGLLKNPNQYLRSLGFRDLPVTLSHAKAGGSLVAAHKDPFDRMLAAQALLEGFTLVSRDEVFDTMFVPRLW